MLGTCLLCKQSANLQWSHIVPAWAYKRLLERGASNPHPIVVHDGRAVRTSRQIAEYMLCLDCEHRFKLAEDYAAAVTYQRDGSAAFLDLVGNVLQEADGFRVASSGKLDTESLCYFGTSIVWRGCVCSQLDDCHLAAGDLEAIRQYLLGKSRFPSNASCMVAFMDALPPSGLQIASFIGSPTTEQTSAGAVATLNIHGLHYNISFGDAALTRRELCVANNPGHYVFLAPQAWLAEWHGDAVRDASLVGSLARDTKGSP